MSLVTGLFCLVPVLNQRWSPQLTLQASHCSTFRIMCDVPSIAVFCSESIECFPGTASKFFLKLLVTVSVAPIITGIIVHFRFHIRCISIHKRLYFIIIIVINTYQGVRNRNAASCIPIAHVKIYFFGLSALHEQSVQHYMQLTHQLLSLFFCVIPNNTI